MAKRLDLMKAPGRCAVTRPRDDGLARGIVQGQRADSRRVGLLGHYRLRVPAGMHQILAELHHAAGIEWRVLLVSKSLESWRDGAIEIQADVAKATGGDRSFWSQVVGIISKIEWTLESAHRREQLESGLRTRRKNRYGILQWQPIS